MLLWWAAFFIAGAFSPPSLLRGIIFTHITTIPLLASFCISIRTGVWTGSKRISPRTVRFAVICSTSILLWIGAGVSREAHDLNAVNGSFMLKGELSGTSAVRRSDVNSKTAESRGLQPYFGKLRGFLLRSLHDGHLSERSRELLGALILAHRSGLDRGLRDVYEYLGIAHFLALSGLHLGILAVPLIKLLSISRLNRISRNSILILILLSYTAVAGFPPSLLRALALAASLIFQRMIGVKTDLLRSLVLGSFILAVLSFETVVSAGYRLSFAAVCGIALIGIHLLRKTDSMLPGGLRGKISRIILFPVLITLSIQLFSFPLVVTLFKRLSLIAPLANLAVMVPVTLLLYAGLIYLLLPFGPFRAVISIPVNLLSDFLWEIPSSISHRPHPAIYRGDVNLVIYSAGVILLSVSLFKRCVKRNLVFPASVLLILLSVIWNAVGREAAINSKSMNCVREGVHPYAGSGKRADFLPVGEGILFIEDGISAGEARLIVKHLWGGGRRGVDFLIIGSSRGCRGFTHILERIKVKELICSRYLLYTGEDIVEKAVELGVDVHAVSRGDIIAREGLSIEVLGPPYPPGSGKPLPANAAKISCRIILKPAEGQRNGCVFDLPGRKD